MSDFYSQNDYRNYLQHHGIKGMHWGEQNGPPYPLSTRVHNMVVRNRQKRAEKRREKILHDPRKLSKHASEFSKEEIDAAVEKIDSINQAKRRITPNRREKAQADKEAAKAIARINKDRAKQQKKADDKMTKKIEKYAPNVTALEQNIKKFNQQELEEALRRLNNKDKMFETKMNRLNRPKKFLDIGVGYLDTIKRGIEAITGLEKAMGLENPNKLTYDELHNEFLGKMYESGKISKYALSDKNWKTLKSESDIKTKEKKAKKEWNREEEKADAAVKEAKAKANLYQAKADEIAWNMARAKIDEVPPAATENFFTGKRILDDDGHWRRPDSGSFAMSDIDEILSVHFSDVTSDLSEFTKMAETLQDVKHSI